jgi:hypothetical protein
MHPKVFEMECSVRHFAGSRGAGYHGQYCANPATAWTAWKGAGLGALCKQLTASLRIAIPVSLRFLAGLSLLLGALPAHASKPAYPVCPPPRTTLGESAGNTIQKWNKLGYKIEVEYGANLYWNTGKYVVNGKYVKHAECLENFAHCSHVIALSWRAYKLNVDKADSRSPVICAQAGLGGGTSPGTSLVETKIYSGSSKVQYKGKDIVCDRMDTSKKGRHRYYRAWIALPPGATTAQTVYLGVNVWVQGVSGGHVGRLAKINMRLRKVTPCYPRKGKPKRSGSTDDQIAMLIVYGGGPLLLASGLFAGVKVFKKLKAKKPGQSRAIKQKPAKKKTLRKTARKAPRAMPSKGPPPTPPPPSSGGGGGVGSIEFELDVPAYSGKGPASIEFEEEPPREEEREDESKEPKILTLSSDFKSLDSNGWDQATITARVLEPSGAPAPGVEVSFSAPKGGELSKLSGVTSQDGSLRTKWRPVRNAEGFFLVEARCFQSQPSSQTVPLEVDREPPVRMELSVEPAELPPDGRSRAMVTALVFGQSGQPVEGARISFFTDQEKSGRDIRGDHKRTDESGSALSEFQMPRHPQGDQVLVFGRIERYRNKKLEPPVEAETTVQVTPTAIIGSVKDQHGNSVGGAKVDLMKAGTSMSLMERTSPEGGFTYHDPKPMAYDIRAYKKGYKQGPEASAYFELEPGQTKQIELVLLRHLNLSLNADRQTLPADGKAEAHLQVELRDGEGEPVPDQELEVSVEGDEPGILEPSTMAAGGDGSAGFTYRAGEKEGDYRIACRIANSKETQASLTIRQHKEPYLEVQLKHHPFEPVLRLYKKPEAAGKFSHLNRGDLSRVEVLGHDRLGPFQGSLGEMSQGWILAALIAYLDCSPNSSFYVEQAMRHRNQAESLRSMADLIEGHLERYDYRMAVLEGLNTFKTYYEFITLPLAGQKGIANWLDKLSLVSTMQGWSSSIASAGQSAFEDSAKKNWRDSCLEEVRLARLTAEGAEDLAGLWESIEWNQGREDLAERLLPRGTVAGDQNEAGAYWAALMRLFEMQLSKVQLAEASLEREAEVSSQVISARQDLRDLKAKWGEALQAASDIKTLAAALPGLQESPA